MEFMALKAVDCSHSYFFLKEMVLLRLKKTILMILLYMMTMLTKLLCALRVTSSKDCWS